MQLSGSGELPDYMLRRFGHGPAKFGGYSWLREEMYADDISNRQLGPIPPLTPDTWPESEVQSI